eukprot:352793_1
MNNISRLLTCARNLTRKCMLKCQSLSLVPKSEIASMQVEINELRNELHSRRGMTVGVYNDHMLNSGNWLQLVSLDEIQDILCMKQYKQSLSELDGT